MRSSILVLLCLVGCVTSSLGDEVKAIHSPRKSSPRPPNSDCKSCSSDLLTISTSTDGSHEFASDVIDASGACAVRTLTCEGVNANIEINYGWGVISDGDNGIAALKLTCNAGSTAWTVDGTTVNRVECASA